MDETLEEFFHDFRQEMLAGAEANSTYQLESFMESVSRELIATTRNLLDFLTSRQKLRWALNLHNCATVTVNRRVRACR